MITQTGKIIALTLMGSGSVIVLIGGIAATCWRKKEVSRADLFWAGSEAGAHPEKYVRPDRVKVVKVLNLAGAFLFMMGVLFMVGYSIWK